MISRIRYIALFFVVFFAIAAESYAVQYARPSGTNSAGSWSPANAASLQEAIDETTANGDTDYIEATSNTTADVSLSSVTDPQVTTGHVIRFSMQSYGGGSKERVDVQLHDNTGLIASTGAEQNRGSYATFTWNLSDVEAGNISDYAQLKFVIISSSVGGGESVRVSWAELEVPDGTASIPTLSNPVVTNIDDVTADIGATIDGDGGASITSRGTVWDTSPNPTVNLQAEGDTALGDFSHNRSFSPYDGTLIYFAGYATNSAGTGYSVHGSFYTEPGTQAFSIGFTNILDTSMRITWSRGNGAGVIVIVRAGGSPTIGPSDGTEHPDNTEYGNVGSEIGTGNYVVYRGTASQVDVTGLVPNTFYYVDIYEYAGSSGLINYQQDAPVQDNAQSGPPAVIPILTTPLASNIQATSATLGATLSDNGGGTITARGTVFGTSANPTGNAQPEGGTIEEPFSHNRTITSLEGTLIYFAGYATNTAGTGYSSDGTFYTEPTVANMDPFSNIQDFSMRVNWTAGGIGSTVKTLVVMREGSGVDFVPSDGTEYTSNSSFDSGTGLGPSNDNYVVHNSNGSFVNVTNLTNGITYHVKVYAFAGSSSLTNYEEVGDTGSQTTTGGEFPPSISTPTVSNIDTTSATLGATIDNDGGVAILARGTVWDQTATPRANAQDEGNTVVSEFSHSRSIPYEGTLIYYAGYATNSAGTNYTADGSFYTDPLQASGIFFTGVGDTDMDISWTPGTGGATVGSLVIVRQVGTVDLVPSDETVYSSNANFGNGVPYGPTSDNYVVYLGLGSTVYVTNLIAETTYYVSVYAYAGGAALVNYQQDGAPTSIQLMDAAPTGHNSNNSVECLECHALHTALVPTGDTAATVCKTCHRLGGEASTMPDVNNHVVNGGALNVDCGFCHETHNGYTFTTTSSHPSGTTQDNLKLIRLNLDDVDFIPAALVPPVYHDPCVPAFNEEPWDGICQACHTDTKYHRNNSDDPNDNHTHPIEKPDYTGQACTGCHPHDKGFAPAISADQDCLDSGCHGGTSTGYRQIDPDFALNVHHVAGTGPIESDDCRVCHMESDLLHYNGAINLKNPDTGAAISVSFPSGGLVRNRNSDSLEAIAVAVQNEFCIKCHDSGGATASNKSGNPLRPFVNNGNKDVANVYDQFDPTNDSHHAVRAAANNPYCVEHSTQNLTTMIAPWNQDTTHDIITCFDCHNLNGHGDNNQRMLRTSVDYDTMVNEAGAGKGGYSSHIKGEVKAFCTECHDTAIYGDGGGDTAASSFPKHAPDQNAHLGQNDLACVGCHAGTIQDSPTANGAAPGNTHGGNWTYPGGLGGKFLMGGWLSDLDNSADPDVDCYGGGCNHTGNGNKTYTRNPIEP